MKAPNNGMNNQTKIITFSSWQAAFRAFQQTFVSQNKIKGQDLKK